MPIFHELLTSPPEHVVDMFYSSGVEMASTSEEEAAKLLKLNTSQLICSLGFNQQIHDLMDIIFTLGYESLDDFLKKRNRLFISDIYRQLSLKQILSIYDLILNNPKQSNIFITKLLSKRVGMLEHKIEKSVKPKLIENYRAELKTIYKTGSIPMEFIDLRLENPDSGFRALLDEVSLIVDSKAISAMEIFIRDSILPEEKRRLITRGLIPKELISKRLEFKDLSDPEREMLEKYLYEAD